MKKLVFCSALFCTHLPLSAMAEEPQCTGFTGFNLPAQTQIFSADSTWNTAIASDAELDPNSATMIAQIKARMENDLGKSSYLHFDYRNWSAPMFVIDSQLAPKVEVYASKGTYHQSVDPDRNGVVDSVPLPDCVWPDPKSDGHMILVDPQVGTAWEFSRFERGTPNQASRVAIWDLNGSGVGEAFTGKGWWAQGITGEGTSYLAGLTRRQEIADQQINHALFVIVPQIRKTLSTDSDHRWELTPPATRTDGKYYGPQFPLAGARIQLDPMLDLSILNLSADSLTIALALQTYGAIVSDQGNNFAIKAQILDESGNGAGWEDVDVDLSNIAIESFRFLQPEQVIIEK